MKNNAAHGRETLAKVYAPKGLSEQMEGYDEWARNYDKDMWSYGYSSPGVIAALLERAGGRALEPVLDAGGENLALRPHALRRTGRASDNVYAPGCVA